VPTGKASGSDRLGDGSPTGSLLVDLLTNLVPLIAGPCTPNAHLVPWATPGSGLAEPTLPSYH